ncbi:MAG: MFS transporter [Burkholderiales bacterium]
MTATERRATVGLAGISGLRLFGMFVILPVLALYVERLPGGASRVLLGTALGIYGLTQAALQVPFGWASDRWGRKPVVYFGLALFAAGSLVAALATDIAWIIVGRALQGGGAISAVLIAMAADLTRDEVRTRAMAVIGVTIGTTFALSLVAGPVLTAWIGVPGIFLLTGALAIASMGVVRHAIPELPRTAARAAAPGSLGRALRDGQLARLNYGVFALHAVLMALFVQVPFALRDNGLAADRHWLVYLPVLVVSVLLMLPFLRRADQPARSKRIFTGAVATLLAAQVALALSQHSLAALAFALTLFFAAFNLLEATLPALISKYAPEDIRGTAVGVYSCLQFLGTFAGGVAGGWLAQHVGAASVFVLGVVLTALWFAASATMTVPPARYRSNYSMGET